MKLKLYTADGASSSEKEYAIPSYEGDKGVQALKQVILAYQANRRQGTVSTKTVTTVHGTGKKPFRQKGTGRARQGSMVRPQHYHGAIAHGPQPRDWSQKVNRKMKRLALARALFERAKDGEVAVIEKWEVTERKTKLFNAILQNIAPAGRVLVLDDSWSHQNILAARNLARVEVTEAGDVNALDLCDYDRVVVSEKGIEKLLSRLNGGNA
ncbi:MAG: large subunit ribosomal protein L4 [Puniceicoccaceae bacterium 5H]|nr:MAG: large subunit ribosomal protein L4 [Puniceicoccaceae bacterium 5H]